KDGQAWREQVTDRLRSRGIRFFSPYKKPFLQDIPEDNNARQELKTWMERGNFDKVAERMKQIRAYDLRLVDVSDFLIASIDPQTMSWGTAEEITTAIREKKPLFLHVEGGKKNTPLWLLGMFPHRHIYDSIEEIISKIESIDSGACELSSDRWKLLTMDVR